MARTIYKICIGLIVALGLVHIWFTDFSPFTMRSMIFMGAGLAIVFDGFLNFVLLRESKRDRVVQALVHLSNLTLAAMFVFGLFMMPEPQVYFGAGLFVLTTVLAFATSK
jgi:uncharacterized membrane protein